MRKLKKETKPRTLEENEKSWTKEYMDCIVAGVEPSSTVAHRYNEPSIKNALIKETHGKCAYCESKMLEVSYGDIEHILPKNKNARPDLYVAWDNLTLSCEKCNRTGKGTYYDPDLPLINPYVDEPDEHFRDCGPLVMPILGDERAFVTESLLKLNRSELVEKRTERIRGVFALLTLWKKETNKTMKAVFENQIREECTDDKEYTSTVKAYLKDNAFPL